MKKGLLILICFACSVAMLSQEKYYIYCQLYSELSSSYAEANIKADVKIFAGEETSLDKNFDFMKNEKGKFRTFKSMVDGLNYMSRYGWEPVQIYTSSEGKSANSYTLLRKEVTKEILEQAIAKKER